MDEAGGGGAAAAAGSTSSSLFDPSTLFILLITLFGFLLPMVIVYPPVPPRQSDFLFETHTKLGVDPGRSGRRDRGRGRGRGLKSKAASKDKEEGEEAVIQSLWIYPIKSCRGIEVDRAKVLPVGLEYDRLYTFAQLKSPFPLRAGVQADSTGAAPSEEKKKMTDDDNDDDQHTWQFITQRQFPLLATLDVELWQPDAAKCRRRGVASAEACIVLRFPWTDPDSGFFQALLARAAAKLARGWRAVPEKEILLPAAFPASAEEAAARGWRPGARVTVWRDAVAALDVSAELPPELARYLGVSNRLGLFRVDPGRPREIFRCAPRRDEAGYQPVTGFQDAYPVHLLSLSSVQDLEAKVPKDADGALQSLDPRRFRANIIVTGTPAYDEDSWKLIAFKPPRPSSWSSPSSSSSATEECRFHVSCRTVRCTLPNVDQSTGARHPSEPDRSLRTHRRVDEGAPRYGCLGMQLTPLFFPPPGADAVNASEKEKESMMEAVVEVGMPVAVLERGAHRYIPI